MYEKYLIGDEQCNGCMLCKQVCSQEAIHIYKGKLGFLYPRITPEKCINCKKCINSCPANNITRKGINLKKCYAIQMEDYIRKKSSSGGMFYSIAEQFIKDGGYVSGAIFNKNVVEHTVVDSVERLPALCKSKYVQSSIENVYDIIKSLVENGTKVLFVGTPCQCDAIKRYCKDNNNLYIMDILCMGVPSQDMFSRYVIENFNDKIKNIDFRFKKNDRWEPTLFLKVTLSDDTVTIIEDKDSSYYDAFLKGISLRQSCVNCLYAGKERVGDLTIGDFWDIGTYDNELDDGLGTSLVLVNTEKGNKLIQLCNRIKKKAEIPIEVAYERNPIIISPVGNSYVREELSKKYYEVSSVNQLVKQTLNEKADCGIINYWNCDDNGAILTAYALQKSLEKEGYSSLLIDLDLGINRKVNGISKKFEVTHLKTTLPVRNQDLSNLNCRFKTLIVGSDQVFRREWVPDSFFLDFADNNVKKIAVSASFGTDELKCSLKQKREIEYWLRRFDSLSAREYSGVKLFKMLGVKGEQIIDPVFWLDKTDYITDLNIKKYERKIISVYFRDDNQQKQMIVNRVKEKLLYDVVYLNNDTEVEKFVECISNSELVITDSYHGVCFSIIFNTKFLCVLNEMRGNARFNSLIELLGLDTKYFISDKEYENIDINTAIYDWTSINQRIISEKARASKWIVNALVKKKTPFPILNASYYINCIKIKDKIGNSIFYLKKRNKKKSSKTEGVICYGAGYFGTVASRKFGEKIEFYIDRNTNIKWHEGKYVYTIEKAAKIIDSDQQIVLSVDKGKREEIKDNLRQYGLVNVIEMEEYKL